MIEIPYKDLSAHALRLRLYAGLVDWPGITVFSRGRAVSGGLQIDASVIGSSHVMEVRSGSLALTELLACEAPASAQPLVLWQPGDSAVEYAARGEACYRFDARVLGLEKSAVELGELRGLIRGACLSATEVGLAYRFPSGIDGPWTAETLVWAAAMPEGVMARTAHTYPSEGLVALSWTRIELVAAVRDAGVSGLAVGV